MIDVYELFLDSFQWIKDVSVAQVKAEFDLKVLEGQTGQYNTYTITYLYACTS
jgi:hypothetical protein